jgi:hypothetical protein
MFPFENAHKTTFIVLGFAFGKIHVGKNSLDQLVLCKAFGLRRRLQVFARDMKAAVPQIIVDRELIFARLRQRCSNRVPKSKPAHTGDFDSSECRLNLDSLTLKLDLAARCLAVFRKEKRNPPACCRGFAISTPPRSVSGLGASAAALQTLPFFVLLDSKAQTLEPSQWRDVNGQVPQADNFFAD